MTRFLKHVEGHEKQRPDGPEPLPHQDGTTTEEDTVDPPDEPKTKKTKVTERSMSCVQEGNEEREHSKTSQGHPQGGLAENQHFC